LGYRSEARPISIGYVDGCADRVWFFDNQRNEIIPAENDNEEIRRSRASFREAELFLAEAENLRERAKNENIHRKSEKAKRVNQSTIAAIVEAKAERRPLTKTQAKADIRLNRGVERQSERDRRADDMLEKYGPQDSHTTSASQRSPVDLDQPTDPNASGRRSIGRISRDKWLGGV
jgi:hypothetical protein